MPASDKFSGIQQEIIHQVQQAVEEAKNFIASGDSASEAAKKAAKLSGHKKGDIYKLLQGEKDNG